MCACVCVWVGGCERVGRCSRNSQPSILALAWREQQHTTMAAAEVVVCLALKSGSEVCVRQQRAAAAAGGAVSEYWLTAGSRRCHW